MPSSGDRHLDNYFRKYQDLFICVLVAATVVVAYWPVQHYGLICLDDIDYISGNPYVKAGLTWDSFLWALKDIHTGYWHPLTWVSHMLDYQLFGSRVGGHHWTNVIFHITNSMLLYIVLKRMSGSAWKSALVAALFAVHPLNVESIAWVSERKNVLCTFFWFAGLWSYAYYVERPTRYRYSLLLVTFSLGLMSKPMIVTFPFTLLLLDYWPLGRLTSWKIFPRLLFEKVPLFILAAIVGIVTFLSSFHGDVTISIDKLSVVDRLANAVVSYIRYLGKMLWPENLAVFYPYSKDFASFLIIGAVLLLAVISCLAVFWARKYPYAVVGWLWYLGTLVPVIGLIQVGKQAMADRYAYIPMIGLFIIVAWGIPDLLRGWQRRKIMFAITSGAVISGLMICTLLQVRYWQNGVTLFEHALQVTEMNSRAHYNLGISLTDLGKYEEAIYHFSYAIRLEPEYAGLYSHMGVALAGQGKTDEAIVYYQEALRIKQNDETTHNNLGVALAGKGNFDEAILHFQEALRIRPDYVYANRNMGGALAGLGKMEEAIGYYEKALKIDGDSAVTHNNLGLALASVGRTPEAIGHFQEALKINPYYDDAANNLKSVQGKTIYR
ncbi:MAG TPA: tetratricopeptide repeat protein [Syntrophales bacterium]